LKPSEIAFTLNIYPTAGWKGQRGVRPTGESTLTIAKIGKQRISVSLDFCADKERAHAPLVTKEIQLADSAEVRLRDLQEEVRSGSRPEVFRAEVPNTEYVVLFEGEGTAFKFRLVSRLGGPDFARLTFNLDPDVLLGVIVKVNWPEATMFAII
jgi:hypothetical protein